MDEISNLLTDFHNINQYFPRLSDDIERHSSFTKLNNIVFKSFQVVCEYCHDCITLDTRFPEEFFQSIKLLLTLSNIKYITIVDTERLANTLIPISSMLVEIEKYTNEGKIQFDFEKLTKALQFTKQFNKLIEVLNSVSITDDKLTAIQMSLRKAKSYQQACADVKEYFEQLPVIVSEAEQQNNFDVFENILTSINAGYLHQLKPIVPSAYSIGNDIQQKISESYKAIVKNASDYLQLGKIEEFNEEYIKVQKLNQVENLLNLDSSSKILQNLSSTIENEERAIRKENNVKIIASGLTKLIKFANDIPSIEAKVSNSIHSLLSDYDSNTICKLSGALEEKGVYGNQIRTTFPAFSSVQYELWNQKTKSFGIDYAVDNIQVSDDFGSDSMKDKVTKFFRLVGLKESERQKLLDKYHEFEDLFKSIVRANSYSRNTSQIRAEVINYFSKRTVPIAKVLANIFAVWSLLKSNVKMDDINYGGKEYWMKPHPVQVISLFYLLQRRDSEYFNQVFQLLTGEGKSVVLGILSIVLAMQGYTVNCICYSEYLSKRDYESFLPIFHVFSVEDKITYSTVNEMCEMIINRNGNIRQCTNNFLDGKNSINEKARKVPKSKCALLIDEVDVFFSSIFYGETYNPTSTLNNDLTRAVLKFIWHYKDAVNIDKVSKGCPEYTKLLEIYPE